MYASLTAAADSHSIHRHLPAAALAVHLVAASEPHPAPAYSPDSPATVDIVHSHQPAEADDRRDRDRHYPVAEDRSPVEAVVVVHHMLVPQELVDIDLAPFAVALLHSVVAVLLHSVGLHRAAPVVVAVAVDRPVAAAVVAAAVVYHSQ